MGDFSIKLLAYLSILILILIGKGSPMLYNGISATFVILNQDEKSHMQRATDLQADIIKSAPPNVAVEVLIGTKHFSKDAAWTFFPILKKLNRNNSNWFIFIEEYNGVEVKGLISFLSGYNHSQCHYLGKMLFDRQPTIIHHFDGFNDELTLYYPDLRAGMALSKALVERILAAWDVSQSTIDFIIDPSYELAKFIFSFGVKLQQAANFCVEKRKNCLLWHSEILPKANADVNSIFFAVKTCRKLAPDRIPVIRNTWLMNAPRHQLYSDAQDDVLGTIDVGVANTESGHCTKTLEIIRQVSKMKDIEWLAIVDDDTLISVDRLASFLKNYSHLDHLALGERYGYLQSVNKGFSYVTGGGGIILSFPLVIRLSEDSACSCPTPTSPDDMVIGACLGRFKVPIVHSRRFHQARVDDYPTELVTNSRPISFHKFWMINPRKSYELWLEDDEHDEL